MTIQKTDEMIQALLGQVVLLDGDPRDAVGAVLDVLERDYHVVPRNPERVTVFVGTCRHHCSAMQIQPGGSWLHVPSLNPCTEPPEHAAAVR